MSVVRSEGAVCVVRGADGEFMQRGAGLQLICPDVNLDESHRIQSHNVSLDMFVSHDSMTPPLHSSPGYRAITLLVG